MKSNLERVSTAIFLIFLGTLFLLGNLDIISWSNLLTLILKYWPVLLVIGGIKIMISIFDLGKWVNLAIDILVDILIILALVYPSSFMLNSNYFGINQEFVTKEYKTEVKLSDFPQDTIKKRKFNFNIGATEFFLTDSNSENLLQVNGKFPAQVYTPEVVSEVTGENVEINFKQTQQKRMYLGLWNNYKSEFNFDIGKNLLSTDIDLNLGAGKGDVVFDQLALNDLDVKVGAGKLDLSLLTKPNSLNIDIGAGEVVLKLPKDSNMSLKYDVGVGNIEIFKGDDKLKEFGGLGARGDYSFTPVLESSYMLNLDANVGAGHLKIVFE